MHVDVRQFEEEGTHDIEVDGTVVQARNSGQVFRTLGLFANMKDQLFVLKKNGTNQERTAEWMNINSGCYRGPQVTADPTSVSSSTTCRPETGAVPSTNPKWEVTHLGRCAFSLQNSQHAEAVSGVISKRRVSYTV